MRIHSFLSSSSITIIEKVQSFFIFIKDTKQAKSKKGITINFYTKVNENSLEMIELFVYVMFHLANKLVKIEVSVKKK